MFFNQFVNPIGLSNISWKYYIVYDCILVLFLFLQWLLFPETKGRTLEEIREIFDKEPLSSTEGMGANGSEALDDGGKAEEAYVENVGSRV